MTEFSIPGVDRTTVPTVPDVFKSFKAQARSEITALLLLVSVMVKGAKAPQSPTAGLDVGSRIFYHSVPVHILAMQAMRVCQAVQGKANLHTWVSQLCPPLGSSCTTVGIDFYFYALIHQPTHYFYPVTSIAKVTEIAVEDHAVELGHTMGKAALWGLPSYLFQQLAIKDLLELSQAQFSHRITAVVVAAAIVTHAEGTPAVATGGQFYLHTDDIL